MSLLSPLPLDPVVGKLLEIVGKRLKIKEETKSKQNKK